MNSESNEPQASADKAASVEPVVMWRWHKLMDMYVLTGDGDKLGRQIATVWENGTWSTWDEDGVGLENGVEIGVNEAKAHASLSAIDQCLLDTQRIRQCVG